MSPLLTPAAQARPLLVATPSASISAPSTLLLGENFTFTVTFDNGGSDTGYGPFLDLLFPVNGADGAAGTDTADGIDFNSASYLALPLTATELTFPDADGAGSGTTGCVDHPYGVDSSGDPLQVCGTAGDKLVVLLLPFGSITPGQPPLEVEVSASLSNQADLGTPLTLKARAGFQYGATPLNDWCCGDPTIVNPTSDDGTGWPSASVTPTLVTLTKASNAPEEETATGPNYPREYTITVNVADGQTVTDLDVFDDLDTNVAYLSTSTSGTIVDEPPTDVASSPPDNQLHVNFASITGGAGADATITVTFFISEFDADGNPVIDPSSGDAVISENQVSALGDWDPIDPRDSGGTDNVVADGVGPEHTLNDRSIAIQKAVAIAVDNGATGLSPEDILEYSLSFQISDYFTFGDLLVTDTFSDGQRFNSGFSPTFSVTDRNGTISGSFTVGSTLTVDESEIGNDTDPATDGTTTLIFDLSAAIVANGGVDGVLEGGLAVTPDEGATTGTITFRTEVQDVFSDTYPSGDQSVDQGDVLDNEVTITGSVRDNDSITTVLGSESDTSAASTSLDRGTLSKQIYAVEGSTSFSSPPQVAPGDTVTYRLIYTLPTSDVEDLVFVDYLPLPIFDASEIDPSNFNAVVDGTIPNAGFAKFGPSDTFYDKSGIVPTIAISGPSGDNSVTFTYGDFDAAGSEATVVDLLFTVTVTDTPFADGLFLTNQARAGEGSTNAGDQVVDSIVQVQIQEPFLVMTKGVIAYSPDAGGTFSPSSTGPVDFTDPGSSNPRWSGTIDSNGLATDSVDSDLSGIDAGDLVSFAIVIENQGSSPYGAFDIQLRDTLPVGFEIPTSGAGGNLSVTRGDGTALSIVEPGTTNAADINDLFGAGIELVDPAPDQGACQVYDPTNGANVVVITYDLQISDDVPPGQEIPNTATLFNYANQEGGEDFTGNDSDLTDDATVTIDEPTVDKTFITTNQAHTLDRDVAIGEVVTYQVVVTVPEGQAQDVVLRDTLDAGLAFVSIDSLTGSSALTSDQGDFDTIRSAATFSSVGTGETAPGRRAVLNFGTLTNSNTDNSTAETITVEYTAVVLNSANNNRTEARNNIAQWRWTANGGTEFVAASAQNVTIVEPLLQVIKSASPTSGDAGDTITFSLVVSHASDSDAHAFELELLDSIPTGMTYVGGSLQNTSGEPPDTLSELSGTISATWEGLQVGETSTLQFQVTLDSTVSAGQVITNTGEIQWTSLPGDVTTAQTSNNALSVERTGDTTDPGGATNDHLDTAEAIVTIFSAPTKSIDSTSEGHTGSVGGEQRLAIGEIVRYRLTFRLAEGTSSDFQLRDRLPAGMRFLNDDTATVAFVANESGISSTTLGTGPQQTGNEATVGSIDPTFNLPDSAISTSPTTNNDSYGSGTDVYFKLGELTNDDRDDDEEYIVVEFNALMENDPDNQAYNNSTGATSATELDNDFQVWVDGSSIAISAPISVWVAEPAITNVSKTATTAPGDAGDTVVYQIVFSNQATDSDGAAAFNLRLIDTLDPNLNSASVTGVTVSDPAGATVTDNSSGLNIDVLIGQLNPGGTVTVEISALVDDDAPIAATISNDAQLTYTSLPGDSGTTSNPTGSSVPGAAGTSTGERTGGDGEGGALNDYADSDNLDLSLDDPAISKVVTDSSVASTGTDQIDVSLTDLVIGETVTFTITATLPEGDSTITVTDDLPTIPDGVLSLVSSEVISIGSNISGSALAVGASGVHSDEDSDGYDDRVVFSFGSLHNEPDGSVTADDRLVMEVVALVENLAVNQNEDQLTNTATIDHDNGSQSATEDVEIVEPLLSITKVADDDTPSLGQTVTYTVTVEHGADSHADAEDIVILDTIPSGLSYVAGSASLPSAQVDETNDPIIEFTLPSLTLAGTTSFTYQATVDSPPSANVGDVLQNTQSMTWTSMEGAEANERDGSGGVDDYSDSANESVTVTGIDLTIGKDDGGDTAAPGDVIIYTLNYENVGNTDASGVVITETVPDDTSYNNANSTPGWSCTGTAAGSTCTFAVGALAPDSPATVEFAVQVVSPAPAGLEQIDNTASITDDGNNGPEPTPANNSDSDVTPVGAVPDLAVTKDDGESIISDGTVLTYAIQVQNIGDQDATGVEATDTVPANTTFNPGGSSAGWSCTPDNSAGSVCTYDIGDLDAGDSLNLTFQVTVDSPLPDGVTSITNTVEVDEDGTNGPEPDETNNTDTDVDNIATDVNTDLTKALVDTNQSFTTGTSVAIGELITYELVLTVPDGSMRSVVWTDNLDQGLAFVSCEGLFASTSDLTSSEGDFSDICDAPTVTPVLGSSANPADDGRELSFDLGDLENTSGSDAALTLRYTAAVLNASETSRGDQLNNSAEVNWIGDGLTAAAGTVTIIEPTLTLEKSVAPEVVLEGGLVTFTLTLEHASSTDADAFDLVLGDQLPPELVYEPGTLAWTGLGLAPTSSDDSAAPNLEISWASFPQGSQSEIQYSARLSGVGPGESVANDAFLEWSSLPGDVSTSQSSFNSLATERLYDPGSPVNVYGVGSSASVSVPALPATGFAPDRMTERGQEPRQSPYQDLGGLSLRIEKLSLETDIVGVSTDSQGWDLTWLSNQAGYLEGTAFPTFPGNTALTGHVYLADGTPGPFHRLNELAWGDEITLKSGGNLYTYQVRQVARVLPSNLSVLGHEDYDWLTLITCEGYYEPTDSYLRRLVVRAVLIQVEPLR